MPAGDKYHHNLCGRPKGRIVLIRWGACGTPIFNHFWGRPMTNYTNNNNLRGGRKGWTGLISSTRSKFDKSHFYSFHMFSNFMFLYFLFGSHAEIKKEEKQKKKLARAASLLLLHIYLRYDSNQKNTADFTFSCSTGSKPTSWLSILLLLQIYLLYGSSLLQIYLLYGVFCHFYI